MSNKFQREKAKRMKKLSGLGISYHGQKKFIKMFNGDFAKLDESLAQIEKIKNKKITRFEYVKQMLTMSIKNFMHKVLKKI